MTLRQTGSFVLSIFVLLALMIEVGHAQNKGRELVAEMVAEVGGRDQFYAMRDVEYRYTYQDPTGEKKDVSIERYLFDGELSWGKYEVRENAMFPKMEGEMIQGYNGQESWVTLDGKLLDDKKVLRMVDFTRKTNYYWFTMMFKLLDDGVVYDHQGTQNVDGMEYDLVKISFEGGVGDVQDTYVLYINPETKLVDQFLFTVLDFGMKDPHLMKVEYEEIAGFKLPTQRKYAPADWDGNVTKNEWTREICTDVKFKNGFERTLFEKPGS